MSVVRRARRPWSDRHRVTVGPAVLHGFTMSLHTLTRELRGVHGVFPGNVQPTGQSLNTSGRPVGRRPRMATASRAAATSSPNAIMQAPRESTLDAVDRSSHSSPSGTGIASQAVVIPAHRAALGG